MKILILGKNRIKMHNFFYELWKQEIARQHDVRYYGAGYGESPLPKNISIYKIIDDLEFEPDLIYTQLERDMSFRLEDMKKIRIPKVHYATEYFYWNRNKEERFVRNHDIDLVFLPLSYQAEMMSPICSARHLPFSVDTNMFTPKDTDRDISVSAVMTAKGSKGCNQLYFDRPSIIKEAAKIKGSFTLSRRGGQRKTTLWHDKYIDVYARSKIAVTGTRLGCLSSRWDTAKPLPDEGYTTYTPQKVVEIPACGALLLTQHDDDFEIMGFRHLENCVVFDQPREIPLIVNDLLERDERRQEIAAAGLKHVIEHHSNEVRVRQFTEMIRKELGIH